MDKIDFESLENVDLESLEQELAKIDPRRTALFITITFRKRARS